MAKVGSIGWVQKCILEFGIGCVNGENEMSTTETSNEPNLDMVVLLLNQILVLYKELGPQSMTDIAQNYLAPAPTTETAASPAEGLMAQAFNIFDDAVMSVLEAFGARQGYNISESKNLRRRLDEGYFRVAYPFLVLYIIWLDRESLTHVLKNSGKFFQSMMLGIAGYMLLDTNLDESIDNPSEILQSFAMIQEHDRLLMEVFAGNTEDFMLLSRFRQMYLNAEVKEKRSRFIESPYRLEAPEECGYKAVHAYLPFALLLQKSGKGDQIDEFLQFFYEWGAPLQIMDDLMDLEDDLKNGHFSYPTLGFEKERANLSAGELAALITSDKNHLLRLQVICQRLIDGSRKRCLALKSDLFLFFVDILEVRLNAFFTGIIPEDLLTKSPG